MRINPDYVVRFIWGAVAVIIVYALVTLFSSCNPVKKVLKDENKMREVWEKGVLKSWCSNDSVYVSDTTILLDTLRVVESKTDTVTVNDTVRITKTELKYITKTVTIRDTTIVTDRSKENLLQKEVSKHLDIQIKLKQDIVNIEAEKKELKKDKAKLRISLWILIALFLGFIFRKPLLRLISPIKI